MFCKNCGKEIDDKAMVCPNCGVGTDNLSVMTDKGENTNRKANPCAIIGFIFSLIAMLSTFIVFVYWVAFAAGLVLSIIGYVKAKKLNSGKGLAIAGIVLCSVSVLLWVLVFFVILAAVGGLFNGIMI